VALSIGGNALSRMGVGGEGMMGGVLLPSLSGVPAWAEGPAGLGKPGRWYIILYNSINLAV